MEEELTMTRVKETVHTLVDILENPGGYGGGGGMVISEVMKAGSVGHGTAVQGHFDLDLVVYSDSVKGDWVLEKGFDYWLDILQRHLNRRLPGKLSDEHRTSRSVQFKYDKMIDVDMLVSPFWREPKKLYSFLQKIHPNQRSDFTVSASKWQIEFFSDQDNQVKEFIKRAKAWRNMVWADGRQGKPKSYLMGILVLRAYETAKGKMGETSTKSMALQTTAEMKKIVKNHNTSDIYWTKNYKVHEYPDLFPKYPPRIVDPANPANNLHESGISGGSNKTARDYGEGGGRWDNFVCFIDSLDLTQTVEEISM